MNKIRRENIERRKTMAVMKNRRDVDPA